MSRFFLSGFADEISSDFSEQLKELKTLSIDYMEIRGVNGRSIVNHSVEEVMAIKAQLDEAGIKISAVGSPIGKIGIDEPFEPHFDLFKHTVEIAKLLETKYIRLFSFFMDEGTAQDNRKEVMVRMRALTDYVAGSDIILLHENEKDIYGDTPSRCLDIVETMASPNMKCIFDPANFVQCGQVTYPDAYEMLKDQVIYMHIKDALFENGVVVPAGQGQGHVAEILGELKKKGYEGFLSLEPHLGEFEGFSDLEGEGDTPEFKEKSDIGKFKLAHESLISLLDQL